MPDAELSSLNYYCGWFEVVIQLSISTIENSEWNALQTKEYNMFRQTIFRIQLN